MAKADQSTYASLKAHIEALLLAPSHRAILSNGSMEIHNLRHPAKEIGGRLVISGRPKSFTRAQYETTELAELLPWDDLVKYTRESPITRRNHRNEEVIMPDQSKWLEEMLPDKESTLDPRSR